jgi:hypothetical protein
VKNRDEEEKRAGAQLLALSALLPVSVNLS